MVISKRPRRVSCRREELSSPLSARKAWGHGPASDPAPEVEQVESATCDLSRTRGCAFAVGRDIGANRQQAFTRTLGRVIAQGSGARGVADLATDLHIRQQPQTPVGEGRGIVCDD